MSPAVGHGDRLGEALGFVVDAAGPDRVHVAPVGLRLGMHERVPVDLRGRGQQQARRLDHGEAERLVGAEGTDLERLDREQKVIDRGGGRREMEHGVEGPVDRDELRDVVVHETETGLPGQVRDVPQVTGQQVVHRDDLVPPGQQPIAEVAAEESRAAGDQDAHQRRLRRGRKT